VSDSKIIADRTVRTTCRICMNHRALLVDVAGDRAVAVRGDPLYGGFTCVKGWSQPAYLSSPDRITQPMKRVGEGFVATGHQHGIPLLDLRL
jgi:anaerobic selenocysteine-containing dehydrogenase